MIAPLVGEISARGICQHWVGGVLDCCILWVFFIVSVPSGMFWRTLEKVFCRIGHVCNITPYSLIQVWTKPTLISIRVYQNRKKMFEMGNLDNSCII